VPRIYFDHNATTRLLPEARAKMAPYLDGEFGNPSSIHAEGRAARQAVELARDQVARLVGGLAEEVVFTSGGTEADNLAVRAALARGRRRVVTSRLEHPAVLASVQSLGLEVGFVEAGADGTIAVGALESLLGPEVGLVTLALANHELGNIYPVAEFAARARAHGALFHTDAVQAAGKLPLSVAGVDLLSISSHKIGGPKGAGALWLRRGLSLPPLLVGGHQERERRPGTENVAALVGFGEAARVARELANVGEVRRLRDRLEAGARALGARVNGAGERVGNTVNLAWEGVPGDLLVAALDLNGVAASTGAACTSGSVEPSPVVRALGQSRAQAACAVRFSLGAGNRDDEVDRVLALLPELLARIRAA
jgi:cysteine desulfurase